MKNKAWSLSEKGSTIITTPLIIAVGVMIVSMIIVIAVNIITPYLWYEKLSSTCIKYIYVMEEFGYLTKNEMRKLKNELKSQGFDDEYLKIGYTSTRVTYGNPIFLKLEYDYIVDIPFGENIEVPMIVTRNSVSKR